MAFFSSPDVQNWQRRVVNENRNLNTRSWSTDVIHYLTMAIFGECWEMEYDVLVDGFVEKDLFGRHGFGKICRLDPNVVVEE